MKYRYFLLSLIIIFILSCTVNDSTGLIKIENRTKKEIKNIKVGDTLIVNSVAPGSDYYYWYFSTISGKVTSDNIDAYVSCDKNWNFKVDYWVTISATLIETMDGLEPYLIITEEKQGPE